MKYNISEVYTPDNLGARSRAEATFESDSDDQLELVKLGMRIFGGDDVFFEEMKDEIQDQLEWQAATGDLATGGAISIAFCANDGEYDYEITKAE